MAGERVDPPYNVDYANSADDRRGGKKRPIMNDALGDEFDAFLCDACVNILTVTKGAVYICMSSSEIGTLQKAFREAGGKWSTFVIWAKNTFTLGRSDYQRQYEPILYGWKQGADHYWCGDRDQGDVWFFDKPAKNDLHPTMKPVALVERAIRNSSKSRDIVLDPFGGSGTTLIAAERTLTDTLIGDADGIYHPALFNDRLLLGLKGTMSEAELHVLRARLNGGIRNKAARGELRRGLPVGFVWGEADGEVLLYPDETVVTAIRTIFARFAETGSARRVWLWFRDQGLQLPLQMSAHAEIRWVEASYHAIHQVLSNPVYAGAYVYGKTRTEMTLEPSGSRRKRIKHLPRDQWQVLIKEHHRGYIDWQTYEANQQRIARNTGPGPHKASGAVREGSALLQGLASCGHCGRRLRTHYRGRNSTPGYHCSGEHLVEGRGSYCLNIGGVQIDDAVARAFIAALEPATIAATLAAAEQLEMDREAALKHWRLGVERTSYAASLAERRYRAVDPDNQLVARGLERAWEESLNALEAAKAELTRRENERPRCSRAKSAAVSVRSVLTSRRSGRRPPQHRATGRSCLAP